MKDLILELFKENIFCLPVRREGGTIFHPDTYQQYRKNVTIESIPDLPGANGIAAIPGYFDLCCLDFDLKNTRDKEIYNKWKHKLDPEIFDHCYIELTRSGGYHVFFRCKNFKTEKILCYSVENSTVIECYCTNRSIIYTHPTPGYAELNKSLQDVGYITLTQAEQMADEARKLNQGKEQYKNKNREGKSLIYPPDMKDKLARYDNEIEVSDLCSLFIRLTGWSCKYNNSKTQYEFYRPGSSNTGRQAVLFSDTKRIICFTGSQPWFDNPQDWSEDNKVAYNITACHLLYLIHKEDWNVVEQSVKTVIPLRMKKYLLKWINKDLLKKHMDLYGEKTIGHSQHVIKVDTPLLVFMMWIACPEYTWTCVGNADQAFTIDDCKEVYRPGCRIDGLNSRVRLNEYNYPETWDA
jgi:hypothetical protein